MLFPGFPPARVSWRLIKLELSQAFSNYTQISILSLNRLKVTLGMRE